MKKPPCPKCGFDFGLTRRKRNVLPVEVPLGTRKGSVTLHHADCPQCQYRLHFFDLDDYRDLLPPAMFAEIQARQRRDDAEFRAWLDARERRETSQERRARLRRDYNSAHVLFTLERVGSDSRPINAETEPERVKMEFRQRAKEARKADRQAAARAEGRESVRMGRAIGVLATHPEWTVKRIAAEAGCHPDYLSRSARFKIVRVVLRFCADCPARVTTLLSDLRAMRRARRKISYRDPATMLP